VATVTAGITIDTIRTVTAVSASGTVTTGRKIARTATAATATGTTTADTTDANAPITARTTETSAVGIDAILAVNTGLAESRPASTAGAATSGTAPTVATPGRTDIGAVRATAAASSIRIGATTAATRTAGAIATLNNAATAATAVAIAGALGIQIDAEAFANRDVTRCHDRDAVVIVSAYID
jgi:hypothetical protein